MRVVFCWATISGYMATCWRLLTEESGIDPFVLAFEAGQSTAFNDELMAGIPCRLLDSEERDNSRRIGRLVAEQNPDVVVVSGWFHPPYRRLPFQPGFRDVRFVMGMDTPWRALWRQHAARWILRPLIRRMDRVVVTGERSWQYAYRLGVPPNQIVRGLYGVDYTQLAPLRDYRQRGGWPRRFVYVGRFAEEKAIDVLVKGYARYRSQMTQPWPLVCCGKGPMAHLLDQQEGIENRGFVQPDKMEGVWEEAGAFVLPSRFDPWPLALVEAAASGLPLICTDACGSAVEIVRTGYNGMIIPDEHPDALAEAFARAHGAYEILPEWGQRAQRFAQPYSAEQWADRWGRLVHQLSDSANIETTSSFM